MTKEETVKEIRKKLLTLLKTDDKVDTWLDSSNLNFGMTKPNQLIKMGREHIVLAFIESAIAGY